MNLKRVYTHPRRHQTPQTYSKEEWESRRTTISQLRKTYTARDIRSILEDDHKYFVNERMLKKWFKEWKLPKYCTRAKKKALVNADLRGECPQIGTSLTASRQVAEDADRSLVNSDLAILQVNRSPQEMTLTTDLLNCSIGHVVQRKIENNTPTTFEEVPGPKSVSHDPNHDFLSGSWYQPSEQPVANYLDLTFGDFTSISDHAGDMDDNSLFSLGVDSNVFTPPSQEESFQEQDAGTSGDGDLSDLCNFCNDEQDV